MDREGQSSSDLAEFWTSKFSSFGHTGWSDQKIYDFDQICRLHVFDQWLGRAYERPGIALDFGAGSGDFSRMLALTGWCVVAYDRYVRCDYAARLIHPCSDLATALQRGPFDLVLSITVLDHIMDDAEFGETLQCLSRSMKPQAKFFFLEYSPARTRPRSSFQTFRTMSEWQSALKGASLWIDEISPFFHPTEAPIPAWEHYRRGFFVRLAGRIERKMRACNKIVHTYRNMAARVCLWRWPYRAPAGSIINVIAGWRDDQHCSSPSK
jgi:SAM-dependent methyltransferase